MKFVYSITLALLLMRIVHADKQTDSMPIPSGFGIDFYDSMSRLTKNISTIKNDSDWNFIINNYNQHVIKNLHYLDHRIPKIIHQIWLGSPFPEKYSRLQASWIEHHPEWQYKLWTDKDIESFGLINKAMYDLTTNYGAKSDIARYEILYRLGGLYVDIDFECLRPLDIFNHCFDFYTGMTEGPPCVAYVALIGAIPGHPILKECITSLDVTKQKHKHPSINILHTTGPYHFSNALLKHIKTSSDACVAFPTGYFYPWPNTHRNKNSPEQIQQWIQPETFAIHHWYISWNNGKIPGK